MFCGRCWKVDFMLKSVNGAMRWTNTHLEWILGIVGVGSKFTMTWIKWLLVTIVKVVFYIIGFNMFWVIPKVYISAWHTVITSNCQPLVPGLILLLTQVNIVHLCVTQTSLCFTLTTSFMYSSHEMSYILSLKTDAWNCGNNFSSFFCSRHSHYFKKAIGMIVKKN